MLTFRRPKLNASRTFLASAVAAVSLLVAVPHTAQAETYSPVPTRSEVVSKPRAVSVRTAKKTTTRRPSIARMPSRKRLKVIRSIPKRVSSGFTPAINGFSFANWATDTVQPTITVDTLVRLFGSHSTCESFEDNVCVPYAKALELVDQLNVILAEGRCEGMVALADELFRHPGAIANLAPDSSRTSALTPEATAKEIAYWWATQITPRANKAAKTTRRLSPTKIVQTVARRLKHASGGTLGLYYKGKGHAVLPIAVKRTHYIAKISVYDSNIPNSVQYIYVNLRNNKWKYRAIADDGTIVLNWKGRNAGGLDLVAPAARTTQRVNFFSLANS